MKDIELVIRLPEEVYTHFLSRYKYQDTNDIGLSDSEKAGVAIKNGTPLPEYMEELKRRLLMEVDGGTDDRYLSYADVCDRISNTMIYSVSFADMAGRLNPLAVIRYLKDTGWVEFTYVRKDIRIFQYVIGDELNQVKIPLECSLSDYKETMYSAVKKIATVENKSVEQVMRRLSSLTKAKEDFKR